MDEFQTACVERVGQLRTAFTQLYESIGADPDSPQDVARKLRVNKTLAWNVARLLQAADELAAVSHVPGAGSLEKVIQATVEHGADAAAVDRAREAVRDFHSMIRSYAGDRGTLDLIIDGTGSDDNGRLELSRKLAFRGNSGLYGVQARTRVVTHVLAPNPEKPDRLDLVMIGGYVGFRRLRPAVKWPIFMRRAWGSDNDAVIKSSLEPIEPSEQASLGFPVIGSMTRGNVPPINPVQSPEGRNFVLSDGPVGNEGAFDCFWGDILRAAVNRFADDDDSTGEFGAIVTAPAETLVMDIIADRDLDFALQPDVLVFGHIFAHGRPTGGRDDPSLLPITQPVRTLTGSPPLVNTTAIPNYPKLMATVYQRMGWDPSRLRGVRLVLEYPPLASNVILRFKLPPRP